MADMPEIGDVEYSITRHSYDRAAQEYAQRHSDPFSIRAMMQPFIRRLPKGGLILDAGCGPGRDARVFAEMGYVVIGIDYSQEMLRLARAEGRLDVRLMDMRDLDFNDESFDGVWANASVHHLSNRDLRLVLAEFQRVLRPGGVLFVSVKRGAPGPIINEEYPNCPRHYMRHWVDSLRPPLAESGFCEYESNTMPGGTDPQEWIQLYAVKPRDRQLVLPFECGMCRVVRESREEQGRPHVKTPMCDQPLWVTPNYIVFPALGQIVEGYLLIVSLEHIPCFGALSVDAWGELQSLKERLRRMLEEEFGPVVFFEHGSASQSRLAGNSVVHAHMHACPAPTAFLDSVAAAVKPKLVDNCTFARECFAAGQPYLLIEDHGGQSYGCAPPQGLPSQFLRRHLARSVNRIGEWDWEYYPHAEQVASTVQRLNLRKG